MLVRDSTGTLVSIYEESSFHFNHLTLPKQLYLKPGFAWGFVVPDGEYLHDSEGKYSILIRKHFGGDRDELTASPITFEVRKKLSPRENEKAAAEKMELIPTNNLALVKTADKEWARLLPDAGQMRRGCVLDAMMSPEEPKNLVVSLSCLRYSDTDSNNSSWEPGSGRWRPAETGDGRADVGRQAADYRVLVLDPDGAAVPLTPFGRGYRRCLNRSTVAALRSTPRSAQ